MEQSTTNFYFASALVALGHSITGYDRSDPKHIKFLFNLEDMEWEDLNNAWDAKELKGSFREYADAVREIKMKIHQE